MSEVVLSYRGRLIRETDVVFLRELIAQNPALSRRRLSVKVCEAWQWVQPNGQLRDMVCRGLMLALHRAGHLALPAQRRAPPNNAIAHRRAGNHSGGEARLVGDGPVKSVAGDGHALRSLRPGASRRSGQFRTVIEGEPGETTLPLHALRSG
jgi:hypothetical protein